MHPDGRIYVAGHHGLVGSAITRHLKNGSYSNLLLPGRSDLDLLDLNQTESFFRNEKPEFVFLAAAKVGGIMANNTFRADFIYENLQIQNNIIHSAWKFGVKKLLFLGSSCIYPKDCPQPMKEEHLLTNILEYTNEPYAIAKIAGMKMCESYNLQYGTNFISVMPTNLYGPNDNYNLHGSHVLPALIRKMHLAQCLLKGDIDAIRKDLMTRPMKGFDGEMTDSQLVNGLQEFGIFKKNHQVEVKLWGSGKPRREFLHSDDLASAVLFVMKHINFSDIVAQRGEKEIRNTHINIGFGDDLSIADLSQLVKKVTGYEGEINWDASKPDGTYRKLMDVSRLKKMGWQAAIALEDGIKEVYQAYCEN